MNVDMTAIRALADREERKRKRRELEEQFRADFGSHLPSARAARARGFAHQIMSILNDYIPHACSEKALEELMLSAYALDVEIVTVPADRDAMNEELIRRSRMNVAPQIVVPKAEQ